MCGRFTQQRPTSELAEILDAENLAADDGGNFNVAPTDEAAVVVQRNDRRSIVTYRWGRIPHSASGPKIAARTFNARAETAAMAPAFRDGFRRKRCQQVNGVRQPYGVVRADGLPLVLAGLWAGWRDPADGALRRTFTIVTTAADVRLVDLHDRMPVSLPVQAWDRWLDPSLADPAELHGLLAAGDQEPLEIHPVVRLVNDVRNDGPELLERLAV